MTKLATAAHIERSLKPAGQPPRHPLGCRVRVLLSSVFGPYAIDDDYGIYREFGLKSRLAGPVVGRYLRYMIGERSDDSAEVGLMSRRVIARPTALLCQQVQDRTFLA